MGSPVPGSSSDTPRDPFEAWQAELHGHEVIYRTVGDGPTVVIVHGMLNSSRHWRRVALSLAERGHRILTALVERVERARPGLAAQDRLYLLGPVPTLIVWGGRDGTIPAAHGRAAHEAIPHSRFELLERAAHFPNLEDPEGLAGALGRWISETEPYRLTDEDWAELIASRTVRSRRLRAA